MFKYNSDQYVFKHFTVNTEDRDELCTCSRRHLLSTEIYLCILGKYFMNHVSISS